MDARVSDEGRPGESRQEVCDRRADPDKLMARGKQGWFAHPHAPATDVCPDKYEKLLKYFQELFCFKFSFIKTIKPGQQDSKCSERREFKKTTHLLLTGSFVIDLGFITNPKNGRVKALSIGCLDRKY